MTLEKAQLRAAIDLKDIQIGFKEMTRFARGQRDEETSQRSTTSR